jgi:hypothetical protein
MVKALGTSWNNGNKPLSWCEEQAEADGAAYLLYLHAGGRRQGGCAWYGAGATTCEDAASICRNNGQDTTAEYGCKMYKMTTAAPTPAPTPAPTHRSQLSIIDPNSRMVTDKNGFSTLDADSDDEIPIKLKIQTKLANEDAFRVNHPATTGTLTDSTASDGRYVLSCPQAAGVKTVQFSVERPKALTAFGGEWVKLYPKDSWANTTNEYEPFLFNEFGAKIPLPEFRPTSTGLANDAPSEEVLHVFMEVKDEGDFEVKYGNPYLHVLGKWVAVEFKSTLLRVGAPWADCTDDILADPSYSVGSIMPVLFGGPNLNSIALKAGSSSYDDVIAELSGVTVPVKVVLEIFNIRKRSYTSSDADGVCYKAGNSCPEGHHVCKAEFCEMDVWAKIIADFKAASPGKVTVLGSIGASTATSQYSTLDLDGFYFVGVDVEEGYTGTSVAAIGAPLFDADAIDDATVYVTLSGSELGIWNPFSWYPYQSPSKWAAIVTEAADTSNITKLVDRGYGWIYLTSEPGLASKSSITPGVLDALEAMTTTRRLQGRRLVASEPAFWGCDDTLLECQPICIRQVGAVTTKVSDALCAGEPIDPCACKCYHEAQWTCEGSAVVCKARLGAAPLEIVGDKVCEMRGAPKPTSSAELRIASECEPMTEMRGSAPTAECLAQWEKQAPSDSEMPDENAPPLLLDAFAAPLALAAIALFA